MRAGVVLPRAQGAELMDEPDQDPAELERSLDDLVRVNRWLGGTRQMLRRLAPLVARVEERPVRVLDVATGSADLPLAQARWARRRGVAVEIVASDFHPHTVRVARHRTAHEPAVEVRQADALALPFPDGAFHLATCSTAVHHFTEEEAVRVLGELGRVASRGVVVTDFRRSRAALLGVRLLAATLWRAHPITRHDAPLSVRRAFTPRELLDLARRAGLRHAVVRADPVFRMALVAEGAR